MERILIPAESNVISCLERQREREREEGGREDSALWRMGDEFFLERTETSRVR